MRIKGIIDEDFIQYKKPSMFISTPFCDFKCEKECGIKMCQNSSLSKAETMEVTNEDIIKRYLDNPITKSIVFGGLETFNDVSFPDILDIIKRLRWDYQCNDDVVIYTGYDADEVWDMLSCLMKYPNIFVKFGRYIPNQKPHYDEVLGVELASDNQYGQEIY